MPMFLPATFLKIKESKLKNGIIKYQINKKIKRTILKKFLTFDHGDNLMTSNFLAAKRGK